MVHLDPERNRPERVVQQHSNSPARRSTLTAPYFCLRLSMRSSKGSGTVGLRCDGPGCSGAWAKRLRLRSARKRSGQATRSHANIAPETIWRRRNHLQASNSHLKGRALNGGSAAMASASTSDVGRNRAGRFLLAVSRSGLCSGTECVAEQQASSTDRLASETGPGLQTCGCVRAPGRVPLVACWSLRGAGPTAHVSRPSKAASCSAMDLQGAVACSDVASRARDYGEDRGMLLKLFDTQLVPANPKHASCTHSPTCPPLPWTAL